MCTTCVYRLECVGPIYVCFLETLYMFVTYKAEHETNTFKRHGQRHFFLTCLKLVPMNIRVAGWWVRVCRGGGGGGCRSGQWSSKTKKTRSLHVTWHDLYMYHNINQFRRTISSGRALFEPARHEKVAHHASAILHRQTN